MALSREETIVAGVGGVALVGAFLLSRGSRGGGAAGQPMFAVTGPSEGTAREMIRSNVELADIFTAGHVALARVGSEERIELAGIAAGERATIRGFESAERIFESVERIELADIAASERTSIKEFESAERITRVITEPLLIQARAAARAEEAEAAGGFLQTIFSVLRLFI